MKIWFAVLAMSIGCGGSGPGNTGHVAPKPKPASTPTMNEIGQRLLGDWRSADTSETWMAKGDRLIGVGFSTSAGATRMFDVMIIHPEKGKLIYTAMPAAKSSVDFSVVASHAGVVKVFNGTHDHPKEIQYERKGKELAITVSGDNGAHAQTLTRATGARAEPLEKLDLAFAADSVERGGAAWADRFEPDGVSWPRGAARTVGPKAVAATIDATRANGLDLRWAPAHSGLSPAGDVGYTVGAYRVLRGEAVAARGIYVSIWRRSSAGEWKIAFATGLRIDNQAREE